MDRNDKVSDKEFMRILLDPKKITLLDLLKNEAMTVARLGDRLGQKPSRLYYHIKKLEDAGLIEVVETKQHGNLIEKYFKAVPKTKRVFEFDPELIAENYQEVMKSITEVIHSGLNILEKDLKSGETSGLHVDYRVHYGDYSEAEWRTSLDNAMAAVRSQNPDLQQMPAAKNDEKKDRYAHLLLSYRLKDAE